MNNSYHLLSAASFLRWLVYPLVTVLCAFTITVASTQTFAETTYRTGLQAERGRLAVSPDGKRLVFTTDRLAHGMRLLDTSSGKISLIPNPSGRDMGFPDWSPDGKRLVVVSAGIRNGRGDYDDMRISLLDLATGNEEMLIGGEGVKFDPFFSIDGKTIYYFKGKRRKEGKTPGSRYELFAIDVASKSERQLTQEQYYSISGGDDDGNSIFFGGDGGTTLSGLRNAIGSKADGPMLLKFDKSTNALTAIHANRNDGLFDFFAPKRDKAGHLYFIAAKTRRGGGDFQWYLARSTPDGSAIEILTELPISMRFGITRNTGAIFVMDRDGIEIILRKLDVTAAY
ncbi:hypothetical protein [uncultured Propionivibrio sp.]|uniref:TolB family protein n=1 Tax=uncultured Propionivibrio sp. TaxID=426737 RepID=UPI0029C0663D|nr:hypothetical protein [uncultured Propionivibrio sp.]